MYDFNASFQIGWTTSGQTGETIELSVSKSTSVQELFFLPRRLCFSCAGGEVEIYAVRVGFHNQRWGCAESSGISYPRAKDAVEFRDVYFELVAPDEAIVISLRFIRGGTCRGAISGYGYARLTPDQVAEDGRQQEMRFSELKRQMYAEMQHPERYESLAMRRRPLWMALVPFGLALLAVVGVLYHGIMSYGWFNPRAYAGATVTFCLSVFIFAMICARSE